MGLPAEEFQKFSGQHVVLVAQRKIQDKESRKSRKASNGQVHNATLDCGI